MSSTSIINLEQLTNYDTKIKNLINAKESALQGQIDALVKFNVEVVDELPKDGVKGTIYLVSSQQGEYTDDNNHYNEYIWCEKDGVFGFELIGDTKLNLDSLKEDVSNEIKQKTVSTAEIKREESSSTDSTSIKNVVNTITLKNENGDTIATTTLDTVEYSVATTESDGLMPKDVYDKISAFKYATNNDIISLFEE